MSVKTKNDASQALASILKDAEKPEKRFTKKKKIVISAAAVVVAAAIATGTVFIVKSKKKTSSEPIYREYTVQRGDIIVGQTESSVITLNKEKITFPVGAEVLELYVKSGSHVSKGDNLIKMSIDDINTAIEDYQQQIKTAKSDVTSAKLNRETELEKAKHEKEQSILNGANADDEYSQALTQAAQELEDMQRAADEAQEKYDDLLAQSKTFAADYAMLTYYESRTETAKANADYWSNRQSSYNEVKSELNETSSEIKQIADVSNYEQAEAYLSQLKAEYEQTVQKSGSSSLDALKAEERVEALENSMSKLKSLFSEQSRLESELALYSAQTINSNAASSKEDYENAKENYENCKSDFTETYGQINDSDSMEKSLSDAKASLDKAKLNLEKQKTKFDSTSLQAKQTKENTNSAAVNAEQTYNLKKIELDNKVNEAIEKYDELVDALAEIQESVGNDGILVAPCDGVVSSLSVEEGDEVSAGDSDMFGSSGGATLMTITDMSEANVSISISEDEILDIELDQEASVVLDAFPDETFDGVVDSISVEGATVGAATVTYTVNVKFTQEGHDLYDGMSADVTLVDGSAEDVLYISKQAITTKDGKSYVSLKGSDGNGVETEIKTGFTDGQFIEILSGLNEGDVVLAESAIGSAGASKTNNKANFDGKFDFSDMSMPSGGFGEMDGAPK